MLPPKSLRRSSSRNPPNAPLGRSPIESWFATRGWQPWPFQRAAWDAYAAGASGLIHVPTGAGKTYAAFGGAFNALLRGEFAPGRGLRLVYVTPLRALARDIELALQAPLAALGPQIRVESRTGDTDDKLRARQRQQLPEILITTPESLALLIARADAPEVLGGIHGVLIDEWHDLMSSKRGVQLQLTLSRLRAFSPALRTWGMSATLRDPLAAATALLPPGTPPVLVQAVMPRPVELTTLLPSAVTAFPWAGHLGLSMLPELLRVLDPAVTNLIFTNTRSQAERWLQALLSARPEWAETLALHHGSLDRATRSAVEDGLKTGRTRIVVATSSLDLGVDFPTVEHVYQIGSPKGIARLLQRAGRAAHRPLASCQATCIPTNSMELVEFAAARRALASHRIEERQPRSGGLDVLAQHLVSCALGGGFTAVAIAAEIRATAAYATITTDELHWCLSFITDGGAVLDAYPAYKRVVVAGKRYVMLDKSQAQRHRMNIGTIVSDEQAELKFLRGQRLGRVEESYVARLRPGDRFLFAGRTLEFVKMYELVAFCKPATGKTTNVPAWQGSFLPLSLSLGDEMRQLLGEIAQGAAVPDAEIQAAHPMLHAQTLGSLLPASTELLLETWRGRDGDYLFVHPFCGRAIHEALAALLALRLARQLKTTFAVVANDYGFGLISSSPLDYAQILNKDLFTEEGLLADLAATVDAAQMAKRRFREIARIAGLVQQNLPGKRKAGRAVHASASLLFDTLARFDPDNRLIAQAKHEATADMSSQNGLARALADLRERTWLWSTLAKPSPFAFPLVVERVRARLGSEGLADRVATMLAQWQLPAAAAPIGEEPDAGRPAPSTRRRPAAATRTRRLLARKTDAHRGGPALG